MALEAIISKVDSGVQLAFDEIMTLYRKADFYLLGRLAQRVRYQKHPKPLVSYVVDRNINYSNVCVCGCRFCAFYRPPGHSEAYVLTRDELSRKIEETISLGGTQILMQGGHHPELPLPFYEEMLSFIKSRFPIHIHAFSPPEIVHFAELENTEVGDVIARLRAAGLDSIPGGGAEILVDAVRNGVSPNKCSAEAWLQVMGEAHRQGLRTTATMMFGHEEELHHRVEHLLALRDLQDRTGGFTAFIPWPFQPTNTAIRRSPETPIAYLRLLALSRIVLDNFDNIQASWVTMGPKVAQLALHFGANDFGSTMIEENVVAATGVHFRLSVHDLRHLILDAGFQARQRTMAYEWVRDTGAGGQGDAETPGWGDGEMRSG